MSQCINNSHSTSKSRNVYKLKAVAQDYGVSDFCKWYHRIFTTVLGICIVDAFYAYKLEMKQARKDPRDFTYFVGRLARQLVFNQFLEAGMNLRAHDDDLENEEEVSNFICLCFEHF